MTELAQAEGMFVGLAIGDALGAPLEFGHNADDIKGSWDGEMQDHFGTKGFYTDDTAMALCLADSLLECSGYNSYDVMGKYLKWAAQGYRDAEGKPASDIGTQTAHAIEYFANNPSVYKDRPRLTSAGNGGIMRIAPMIIATADQPIKTAIKMASISSRETHYSEEADAGAEVFGAMLWQALHVDQKEDVVDVAKYSTGEVFDDILARIQPAKELNHDTEMKDVGGYVVDAIKIAVWGFLNFDSFRQGMIEVIRLGGDADTNAAIYGQLAGAYYSYNAIPEGWLNDLPIGDEIRELASKLLKNQPHKIIHTRFEEDDKFFKEFKR